MGDLLRRFSGPVIGFLVASGLQVSGIEAPLVAAILWTVAVAWTAIGVLTWEPVRTRLGFARTWLGERSPVEVRSPIVRKRGQPKRQDVGALGFLDFEAIAIGALERMTKEQSAITREIVGLGNTFARYTPKFEAATNWSADAKRALGKETGAKVDKQTGRLEAHQVAFRREVDEMAANYLERIAYMDAETVTELRPTIVGMREAVAESRPGVVGMQDATIKIRTQSVQQAINQAADHLEVVLGRLISDFDAVTRFTTDALTIIDEKIAVARVEKAEAEAEVDAEEPAPRRGKRPRGRTE